MPRHNRWAARRKRSPSDNLEDSDSKRVRHAMQSGQVGETQIDSTATLVDVAPDKKCPREQSKDEANASRPPEEVEEPFVKARPAVSRDASSRSISSDGSAEAVVTEDEDRGGTIETAIVIDDGDDEDEDSDAPEDLANHSSHDPDYRMPSAQRYTSKGPATVDHTPEGFKVIRNLGKKRLITGFMRFKNNDAPRVVDSDSLESLTAEEWAQRTANLLQPLWRSNEPTYTPMSKPPADHDLVPIDLDDPIGLQVPASILRKPSPRLYENLGLNEDGTRKPCLPQTRATNAVTPAEMDAEDSTDADVEVVKEILGASAGSEGYEEEVDTATGSCCYAQLETSAVERDIHLRDALSPSTNIRDLRSIETGAFEFGGPASVEAEGAVNGITETRVPASILGSPASAVVDEVGIGRPVQRLKPRRSHGPSSTQIPSAGTPSLSNTSNGNVSFPISARATHPHAELALSLSEEINQLEEEKAKLATAKAASSAYSDKLYLENVALRKLLKQNAPHVHLTAELSTINIASAVPSTTASTREHFQDQIEAGPANSSIIDLTHDSASIGHNNILNILSAAEWLDGQKAKLRQDNESNSFGQHKRFPSDDERHSTSMPADGRQDLPRYMVDRVWAAYSDVEKAEAAIASLLKLDSFAEQERFLSEIAVKEAENNASGTDTGAVAGEASHEPSPRRPSVSPTIYTPTENVINGLQKVNRPHYANNAQPSVLGINRFYLFSSALAVMKGTAPRHISRHA